MRLRHIVLAYCTVQRGLTALLALAGLLFMSAGNAAVLPEDRADIMFHQYTGGGLTVNGPAILVRKGYEEKVSVAIEHYVDNITSATIDVVSRASEYSEHREENTLGLNYLVRDSLLNFNYTKSDENDYNAQTLSFGLSQEVFGGMTTISMNYARGDDVIGQTGDPLFEEKVDRDSYTLGLSQVLTKSLIISATYDAISDAGFLNNPYRGVRIGGPTSTTFADEVYPETRRSHAASLTALQYLPYQAALRFSYRYFWDTWDINANTYELGYSQYLGSKHWILDGHVRFYSQSSASFYADYFVVPQEYMARDKELSTFDSQSVGFKLSYQFLKDRWSVFDKASVNLSAEVIRFRYDNYTDITSPDFEKYEFTAKVAELFVSLWY